MNLKKTYIPQLGYTKLLEKGKCSLSFLEFGILQLKAGGEETIETGENEMALVILSGRCTIRIDDLEWKNIGCRLNVFSGPACSAFVPRRKSVSIASDEKVSIAVVQSPTDIDGVPMLIRPEDVIVKQYGRQNWKRDTHYIIDERVPSKRLLLGEMFLHPGNWFYPPHKHDTDNMPEDSAQDEIFYFQFNLEQGFGIQRIYTGDKELDEVYVIENNDLVEISKGYHTFVTAPGYCAYCLWAMAGKNYKGMYREYQKEHQWHAALDMFLEKNGL